MMADLSKQVQGFINTNSRKGKKCAECGSAFTADNGDGKVIASFRNIAGGLSLYVLCARCGTAYKKRGKTAIPNAVRDAYMAAFASPYAPKGNAPVWIH